MYNVLLCNLVAHSNIALAGTPNMILDNCFCLFVCLFVLFFWPYTTMKLIIFLISSQMYIFGQIRMIRTTHQLFVSFDLLRVNRIDKIDKKNMAF